jgi:hypothetical protein
MPIVRGNLGLFSLSLYLSDINSSRTSGAFINVEFHNVVFTDLSGRYTRTMEENLPAVIHDNEPKLPRVIIELYRSINHIYTSLLEIGNKFRKTKVSVYSKLKSKLTIS